MRTHLSVIKLAILQQTTYRTAMIAGLATNFFFGILRAAVVAALYAGQTEVNGMSLVEAITFVAVGQAAITFVSTFGSYDLMQQVISGDIGAELLRPVSLYTYWMAKDFGKSLVDLTVRGLLLLLAFSLFYPLQLPGSPGAWLGAVLAFIMAWLVNFAWRFLANLSAFFTPDARGVLRGLFTISQLLMGFLFPLRLFPEWFARFCELTPFPAMFNTAMEAFLGLLDGPQLLLALGTQALWFAVLTGLAYLVLRLGVRKLVIQGG